MILSTEPSLTFILGTIWSVIVLFGLLRRGESIRLNPDITGLMLGVTRLPSLCLFPARIIYGSLFGNWRLPKKLGALCGRLFMVRWLQWQIFISEDLLLLLFALYVRRKMRLLSTYFSSALGWNQFGLGEAIA